MERDRLQRLREVLGTVLDKTILFSFDQTGYRLHSSSYDPTDVAVDIRGKTCLVTGANAGVGRCIARGLAERGGTVRLLCRDAERGMEAVTTIRHETGNNNVFLDVVDMASATSIRAFAMGVQVDKVDVLVHNAGGIERERGESPEGLEMTFATQVAGPFLLTELLRDKLAAARGRVIFVSSGGMYTQKLDVEDLLWTTQDYDGISAYALAKRAQVVLSELFAAKRAPITFYAMHSGWVDNKTVRTLLPHFWRVVQPLLRSADEGADTAIFLAVSPRVADKSGLFWFDRRSQKTHLIALTQESEEQREHLWELCRRVTGVGA